MRRGFRSAMFVMYFLIALLAIPLATPAHGQVTLFTNRQSFEAAIPNLTTIDFASALAPGQTNVGFPGQMLTLNGVNFQVFASAGTLGVIAPSYGSLYQGWNTNPTVLQSPGQVGTTLVITLPSGTKAVGTDIYTIQSTLSGTPPYQFGAPLTTTLASGQTFTVQTSDKPALAFVGFTSDQPITSLTFYAPTVALPGDLPGGYVNLANFVFSGPQQTVASVNPESVDSNDPLDDNPQYGGKRIFADSRQPGLPPNRTVRITATLSSPVANVPVFFRSFDLDDPNPPMCGNPSEPCKRPDPDGNDNRGTPAVGQLSAASALTDSMGVVQVTFTISMFPGDNYVVAASTDQTYLNGLRKNGVTVIDADGQASLAPSTKVTPMLTVWRRLHIEVDSMAAVQGNTVQGVINAVVPVSHTNPAQTAVWTLSNIPEGASNRFEFGRLTITGIGAFPVLRTASCPVIPPGGITCTVIYILGSVRGNANKSTFTLVDDDDFNSNNGINLHGDEGEELATVSALQNVVATFPVHFSLIQESADITKNTFSAAYIEPRYDGGGNITNNSNNVHFILNVANVGSAIDAQVARGKNALPPIASDAYWVGYVQLAYQADVTRDHDPDAETQFDAGSTNAATTDSAASAADVFEGGEGSLVFLETLRDGDKGINFHTARVVPHEVGHQFGLHGDAPGFGIMSVAPGSPSIFVDPHLNILRWRVHSPGLLQ